MAALGADKLAGPILCTSCVQNDPDLAMTGMPIERNTLSASCHPDPATRRAYRAGPPPFGRSHHADKRSPEIRKTAHIGTGKPFETEEFAEPLPKISGRRVLR